MKTKLILILLLFNSTIIFSQWSTDPAQNTPICTESGNQLNPHIVVDKKGNSIIVWEDQTVNIYAQRLNRYGYKTWDNRGVPVCTKWNELEIAEVICDRQGGAIIVWLEYVDYLHGDMTEETDIYAQRIDSTGALLWDYYGLAVCTAAGDQYNPKAVCVDQDETYIVWNDGRPGYNGVYVQLFNETGDVLWSINGIPLNSQGTVARFGGKNVVPSDSNSILIFYASKKNNVPISTVQKVRKNGEFLWQENIKELDIGGTCISDGKYGALFIFNIYEYGDPIEIRAQRINKDGNILWSDFGNLVSDIVSIHSRPEIATDGQGGAFISWSADTSTTKNRQLYFSRVDSSGKVIWINKPISNSSRWSTTEIVSNNNNGAIFCYAKDSNGNNPVYYLRNIDQDGLLLWENDGIIYSTKQEEKGYIFLVGDSFGSAILVWSEFPHDIYAQQVSSHGNLGEVITSVSNNTTINKQKKYLLLNNYPNPFNSSTQISYQILKGGDVSLKIYNLNGQIVKSLINQKLKEGKYDIIWNGKDENNNQVTSGIYLIELFSSRLNIIKKITLVR